MHQVRSHAQKYFQKMVKGGGGRDAAEQAYGVDSGAAPTGLPGSGIPRPYQQQRRQLNIDSLRRAIPVPPPLQPFVPPGSGDLHSGLVSYLTPACVPTGQPAAPPYDAGFGAGGGRLMVPMMAPAVAHYQPGAAGFAAVTAGAAGATSAAGAAGDTETAGASGAPAAAPAAVPAASAAAAEDTRNSIPEWYRQGRDMGNLLEAAESIDWPVRR